MTKIPVLLFVLFLSIVNIANAQTSPEKPSNHQAKKWFKKGEWLNGLQLKPSKTVDYVELYRQYHANKTYWDKAFEFLKTQDLQSLKVGRQNIDGDNVYATVQDSPTKDYVIRGKEKIGRVSPSKLSVTRPYAEARDVANYSGEGPQYEAVPGTFFLFFPSDAHRPNIMNGDKNPDKKIVIKIRYTE